jgi:hypothetical protein
VYTEQAGLLNKRAESDPEGAFAASFSGLRNESTGAVRSYCMWAEGLDSLLPQTDDVMLVRPKVAASGVDIVATAPWERVVSATGALMEPQGMYPERWRVRKFPSQTMIDRIAES